MRKRTVMLCLSLIAAAPLAAGCGSSGDEDTQTTNSATVEQSYGGFPGAGSPTAPDVTTTPGKSAQNEPGQAGGGSSATCVGC
jgi:hypothetical protein